MVSRREVLVGAGGGTDDEDLVTALDAASGEVRWRVRLDDPVDAIAPVDGAVFSATASGTVAKLR